MENKNIDMKQAAINMINEIIIAKGSKSAAAKYFGISASHLNDVLKDRRSIPEKVLKKMGMIKIVAYIPKARFMDAAAAIDGVNHG